MKFCLDTIIVSPEKSYEIKNAIILLHGYGDHADNFIPLAEHLNDNIIEGNFFAPNAPFEVPQYPLGRQWFNPYPNGIHFNEVGIKEKQIMKKELAIRKQIYIK